jgi:phosphoglycolate phosphatase-like HAD superfamily hydrolase
MVYPPPRRADPSEQASILRSALAALGGGLRTCVFDLDSTLLCNHPRQAAIVREFGAASGDGRLTRCTEEQVVSWDQRDTLRLLGLTAGEVEATAPLLRDYWRTCFFTSRLCVLDTPNPGARAYLERALEAGGRLVYLTGRPQEMEAGTLESFRKAGFPLPEGARVLLWCKPDPQGSDDAWKKAAHERLAALGPLACAFDNEPEHINGYKQSFPAAVAVHLDTDHSGRPIPLRADVPSVRDFVLEDP